MDDAPDFILQSDPPPRKDSGNPVLAPVFMNV